MRAGGALGVARVRPARRGAARLRGTGCSDRSPRPNVQRGAGGEEADGAGVVVEVAECRATSSSTVAHDPRRRRPPPRARTRAKRVRGTRSRCDAPGHLERARRARRRRRGDRHARPPSVPSGARQRHRPSASPVSDCPLERGAEVVDLVGERVGPRRSCRWRPRRWGRSKCAAQARCASRVAVGLARLDEPGGGVLPQRLEHPVARPCVVDVDHRLVDERDEEVEHLDRLDVVAGARPARRRRA